MEQIKTYKVSNRHAHNVEYYRNYLYNQDQDGTEEFKSLTEIVELYISFNYRGYIIVNSKQFGLIQKCFNWAEERRS